MQLQDLQNTMINLTVSKRHGISSPGVRLLASKIHISCVELITIYRMLNCVCKAFARLLQGVWTNMKLYLEKTT